MKIEEGKFGGPTHHHLLKMLRHIVTPLGIMEKRMTKMHMSVFHDLKFEVSHTFVNSETEAISLYHF
jgi:hypothetical protein